MTRVFRISGDGRAFQILIATGLAASVAFNGYLFWGLFLHACTRVSWSWLSYAYFLSLSAGFALQCELLLRLFRSVFPDGIAWGAPLETLETGEIAPATVISLLLGRARWSERPIASTVRALVGGACLAHALILGVGASLMLQQGDPLALASLLLAAPAVLAVVFT